MKLSAKIFLGICLPSLFAIVFTSFIFIEKNHKALLDSETQHYVQELNSIENGINDYLETDIDFKDLFETYSKYYEKKGLEMMYYDNDTLLYSTARNFKLDNKQLLQTSADNYSSLVCKQNGTNYILTASRLKTNGVLICVHNIDSVFKIKQQLINICIISITCLTIIILIIAFIISRSITKPITIMRKEMNTLSKGDYNIEIQEFKGELGILAKAFNNMSTEIRKRNDEQIELLNSKQLFIDNLAHEMNTPLTSILGYAELMEKANLPEDKQVKYLKYIQEETKRILDMYKKLLLLSYKQNADFETNKVDIPKALEEIRKILAGRLEEKNITLVVDNSIDYIYGDETLIIMSICNLVKNSILVSDNGSQIIIKANAEGQFKYINVIDSGPGISEENIKKITEPFYRVDKARSRQNGGAGLGLSICKSIMDMHGGALMIKSVLGEGSIFTLSFPEFE